jgi:hypothetical protein
MLVPVPEPLKGLLVLGEQTVTYLDGIVVKATPIDQVQHFYCCSSVLVCVISSV